MSIKWVKPNGNEIETNDEKATIEHAESVGWKLAEVPSDPAQIEEADIAPLAKKAGKVKRKK